MSTARYPAAVWGVRRLYTRAWPALRSPAAVAGGLALLLLATGAFLLHETRGTTLWFDEWNWALYRRGGSLGTFLDTYNGHLSLVPVAIFKLLYATVGLRHYLPYRLLVIVGHLAVCLLLFVYARRRVGVLLALLATLLLLFFAPGWENILWPFQITWLLSLGGGLVALLALDRRDLPGDILACLALVVALASSGIGVPVAVGVLIDFALTRRTFHHAWVIAIPVALYALWSLGYQHTTITRHDVVLTPGFAASGLASTFAALAGLAGTNGFDGSGTLLTYGPALAVAAGTVAVWRLHRLGHVSTRIVALTAMLVSFWLLSGLTRSFLGLSYSSRYLYVSAMFVLLLAVELLGGIRVRPGVAAVASALVLAAVVSNIGLLRQTAGLLRTYAGTTRADLAALDIGRPLERPGYVLRGLPGYPFVVVPAGDYFAAARALGSPAASPLQLAAASESARETADAELIRIHQVALRPAPSAQPHGSPPALDAATLGTAEPKGACLVFTATAFTPSGSLPALDVTVPPSGLLVQSSGTAAGVSIRRFGSRFQPLGTATPGEPAGLLIAADGSSVPWHLQLAGTGRLLACGV